MWCGCVMPPIPPDTHPPTHTQHTTHNTQHTTHTHIHTHTPTRMTSSVFLLSLVSLVAGAGDLIEPGIARPYLRAQNLHQQHANSGIPSLRDDDKEFVDSNPFHGHNHAEVCHTNTQTHKHTNTQTHKHTIKITHTHSHTYTHTYTHTSNGRFISHNLSITPYG